MRSMKHRARQLRSLGRRGRLLLLLSAVTILSVTLLVAFGHAHFALIPIALLLAAVAGQLIFFERHVLTILRRVEQNSLKTEAQLDPDRIEFMQQRILASIETGRLEAAERFDKVS